MTARGYARPTGRGANPYHWIRLATAGILSAMKGLKRLNKSRFGVRISPKSRFPSLKAALARGSPFRMAAREVLADSQSSPHRPQKNSLPLYSAGHARLGGRPDQTG